MGLANAGAGGELPRHRNRAPQSDRSPLRAGGDHRGPDRHPVYRFPANGGGFGGYRRASERPRTVEGRRGIRFIVSTKTGEVWGDTGGRWNDPNWWWRANPPPFSWKR